jgi:hypothetical protein
MPGSRTKSIRGCSAIGLQELSAQAPDPGDPGATLWSLLTLITLRNADRARYYQADCRDESGGSCLGGERAGDLARGRSREPTPEHAVVLAETVEKVREVGADERWSSSASRVFDPGDQRAAQPGGTICGGCGASSQIPQQLQEADNRNRRSPEGPEAVAEDDRFA